MSKGDIIGGYDERIPTPTREQQQAASRTVARKAHDHDDCVELLDMIGLKETTDE